MSKTRNRFEVDVVAPKDLRAEEILAWRGMQDAEPELANPLFGPEFSQIVGRVREDARVAVYRLHGEAVAFLAFHQRPGGLARPIGAPFSDYQALVSKRDIGLTGKEALTMAGLKAYRFNGLVDPHSLFEAPGSAKSDAYAIELDRSPEDFLEAVRAASPKKFKNYRRLEHRLEREIGPLRLVADEVSPQVFAQILEWKSDQFRRTGLQDVLRPQWISQLMRLLFQTRRGPARGLLMTLYAGDTLIAGHFGIRSGTTFHPWIASSNPDLAAYSPGQAFLGHAIRAMPQLGLKVYDLGPGHDHYKRPYANVGRSLSAGLVTAAGPAGALAGAGERVWAISGLGRVGAIDKIRRRIDHIAAIDPTPSGFLRGLAEAALATKKRSLGNEPLSEAVA